MLERVMRAMMARGMVASAIAGSIRWRSESFSTGPLAVMMELKM